MIYRIKGNYPALLNGLRSYVIIEFFEKTRESAEKAVEKRKHIYTDLEIIEEE